jgi:DNA-binding PadR family transcriptional regulator
VGNLEDKLIAYGYHNSSLPLSKKRQAGKRIPIYCTKSKILKTFLDIAILNEMTQMSAVSVPATIEFFVKKYFIYITPGTVYPVFNRLERQGYIVKLPNRLTRLYSITIDGKNMLENVQQNIDELQFFLLELVKTQGDQ